MRGKVWKAVLLLAACLTLLLPVYAKAEAEVVTVVTGAGGITDDTGKWVQNKAGYYFWQQADGTMLKTGGFHTLGGQRVFLINTSGRRAAGWVAYCGKKYYCDPKTGVVTTGFRRINGSTYFFSRVGKIPGAMKTGFLTIDGNLYFFNKNGSMLTTSWKNVKGNAYYFQKKGTAGTGWLKVDGKMYYFDTKTHIMKRNTWLNVNGTTYFMNKNGLRATGLTTVSGKLYYLDSTGKLVRNKDAQKVGTRYFKINNSGVCTEYKKEVEKLAIERLNIIGWDLRKAYNWCAREYREVSNNVPAGQNVADWYATIGFKNGGYGDCYVLAAMFTQMAKILGMDAHFVMGSVPTRLSGNGAGPHGWCEIDLDGKTYICDPDFEIESGWGGKTKKNGYMFVYGTSGTYRYQEGKRMN